MAPMIALTHFQWGLVALMGLCYAGICLRMALRMAATGRSLWKWLLITFFCTGVPAAIVLYRDEIARRMPHGPPGEATGEPLDVELTRCPHCGRLVPPGEPDAPAGLAECPHCHLPIDEAKLG